MLHSHRFGTVFLHSHALLTVVLGLKTFICSRSTVRPRL